MEKILLHGTLHVSIYDAEHLIISSGGGFWHKGIQWFFGDVSRKVYAKVDIEGAKVARTRSIADTDSNPRWDEQFRIYCAHIASEVVFTLKDHKAISSTLIGRAYLPVKYILSGEEIYTSLDILNEDRKPIHKGSKLNVKVKFLDVCRDEFWDKGIKTPEFPGVPFTFFPQRDRCRVTLYQDAHVPGNFVPRILLAGGKYYEPQHCWEDIFDAINGARHLIYIAGWSACTFTTLVRDIRRPKPGGDMTLGELLKKKANQGVRVLMLVWDDALGMMCTRDEETASYFKGTEVHCVLCRRDADGSKRKVHKMVNPIAFTHHQKIVVVDSALPSESSDMRRIVSFVGGIDLCDGRYDTQFHSLFRTLNSTHHDDFHQPNFKNALIKKGGPREPWHDIHSRLEGTAAWDVFYNFEQRWKKQGQQGLLLDHLVMSHICVPPVVTLPDDQETWNVQVFRSIDGGAIFGFPEPQAEAARIGLVSGKISTIDRSIQDAYILAIRRAKRFIYIENQYFIGSSFGWKLTDINPADIGALHLIPKELSLKIVSKIEKGERFAVYVVVPMWPEGKPDSDSVQAILDWQRRTMEMMYTDVTQALRAKGIKADPKDYLSFFCLGNREVKKSGEYEPGEQPEPDTDYARAQEHRRFMIYVHSKTMIVDDEYIIVGSANINQRSMDGGRDSEIAMGAYQPYHIAHDGQTARGQIHGFRMSLWYEHMGMLDEAFLNPESLECVGQVNSIADKHLDMYVSESLEHDLPGHLLSYPVGITEEGEIVELPGLKHFPDTTASVLGKKSDKLPVLLTT